MSQLRSRLQALVSRHRFTFAISIVVSVSLILTAVSLSLYVSSGAQLVDLSRPGYESVRQDIKIERKQDFASSGSINSSVLNDFQKQFDDSRSELNSFGQFKDNSLDDSALGLTPESAEQPTASN